MGLFKLSAIAGVLILIAGAPAYSKTVRATEIDSSTWAALEAPGHHEETIIEFRQGDQLPVSLSAEGDLLETNQASVGTIGVKRNFWIRVVKNDVEISFDGTSYKAFKDALTGSFQAGAGNPAGGIANSISLAFKAYLK